MSGARPEQAYLSKDTDMSKTEETRAVIENMVDGLNDHRIVDIGEFFSESFRWMGNTGCGTKDGIRAFQDNWQNHFKQRFQKKFVLMRLGFIWVNGPPLLEDKKLFIVVFLWVLSLPTKKFKSDTWIFGKSKMEKLLIIG